MKSVACPVFVITWWLTEKKIPKIYINVLYPESSQTLVDLKQSVRNSSVNSDVVVTAW